MTYLKRIKLQRQIHVTHVFQLDFLCVAYLIPKVKFGKGTRSLIMRIMMYHRQNLHDLQIILNFVK